jgi:hypothetical protein
MKDYIIISFLNKQNNSLIGILDYIKKRFDPLITIEILKLQIVYYLKHKYITIVNNDYYLSDKGKDILNFEKIYYAKIITYFFKKIKYRKKFSLKEIRLEQQKLRNYLIYNKPQICVICSKNLPLCLLETAHLKPRYLLTQRELNDLNIIEFMCRYCHKLYDEGLLTVNQGKLQLSSIIQVYNLNFTNYNLDGLYNLNNKNYFDYHFSKIFQG